MMKHEVDRLIAKVAKDESEWADALFLLGDSLYAVESHDFIGEFTFDLVDDAWLASALNLKFERQGLVIKPGHIRTLRLNLLPGAVRIDLPIDPKEIAKLLFGVLDNESDPLTETEWVLILNRVTTLLNENPKWRKHVRVKEAA